MIKYGFLTSLFISVFISVVGAQPLSGLLSVGGVSPDYTTLTDAVNDLNSKGVDPSGVVFSIRSGDYVESLLITAKGTESGKIRFVSEDSDAASVRISYGGSGDVIRLQGAAFIQFEFVSVVFNGSGNYSAVEIMDNSDDITIRNCIIEGADVTNTTYAAAAIYASETTPGNDCERIVIEDNIIRKGSYAISLSMSLSQPEGYLISGNRIEDFYGSGIYLSKLNNLSIIGNSISTVQTGNTSAKGISFDNCDGAHRIMGNYIFTGENGRLGYGLQFEGSASLAGDEILVANNSVQVSNTNSISYGIYQSNNSNWYLYHSNTIFISAGTSVASNCYNSYNAAQDTWLVNNIFVNAGTATGANANRTLIIANTTAIAGANTNCYYTVSDGNPFKAAFGSNFSNYQSYADAIGETAGVNIDPQMIFIEGKGWKASNPGLSGMGADTSLVPEDIDGYSRFHPTSIGAHEIQVITGVQASEKEHLNVFYFDGQLMIQTKNILSELIISDLSGRQVLRKYLNMSSERIIKVPFRPESPGIYVAMLTSGKVFQSLKFPVFD